ncbi:5-oxoprolinase subunit B family protein, partial [Mycobacterium sp.]|uniref:5-oxoprolinase subunit B family protein n=1 Tax=Mycobacterium sp. TaxID=1785 RepID=UPI003BB1F934
LWKVGFCGFAPGFAYLVGGDPRLAVPRRSEPRPSVPAGAVGLAGEFTGIYPRRSPGGWQLIGHTDAVLWDIDRPHPALLTPGMWVQFRAA